MAARGGGYSAGVKKSDNRPVQCPPRDVLLEPSAYMPASAPVVTASTASAVSLPPASRLHKPGKEGAADEKEVECQGAAEALDQSAPAPCISESCKFSIEERERLLQLRSRLVSCSAAMRDLCQLVSKDEGSNTGLPFLREVQRVRLRGCTYSVEDARRELGNEWFVDTMKQYIAFVDNALADKLDVESCRSEAPWALPSPVVPFQRTESPPQNHEEAFQLPPPANGAAEGVSTPKLQSPPRSQHTSPGDGAKSTHTSPGDGAGDGFPPRSPSLRIAPSPTPRINGWGI
eukprot:gnl/TRDRNA2_/TRDRNA2_29617_c0_seq1.p1 gnl/TRDRNA2_/TRDRNA2_29617_c0~~gnl/TRDRNA2_/TRDRNA2_29617_c0_seq1.p1  ORF type:complete len:302 (+),score=53.65 gnl/TRDRNA2_/TRDRNA2_29617_c0_seq1:41-907(+)